MKKNRDVYFYIRHFIKTYKASPTYGEICRGCGIKSKSHVYKIVNYLIENNYIEKNGVDNVSRRLALTKKRYRITA